MTGMTSDWSQTINWISTLYISLAQILIRFALRPAVAESLAKIENAPKNLTLTLNT